MKQNSECVSVFSSAAGRCLTQAEWLAAGVKTAAYSLASLLMKPGLTCLETLPSLASYLAWPKALVLDATLPYVVTEGHYRLQSTYDGSRSYYSPLQILTLIKQLQPHYVLLPQGIHAKDASAWLMIPETTFPFFPLTDCPIHTAGRPYGVYATYHEKTSSPTDLMQALALHPGVPAYVAGDLSFVTVQALKHCGVQFIQTDCFANDAYLGFLYAREGIFSIQDETQAKNFTQIDALCTCPTCRQSFTRAYLHHLLMHTPLLCQRMLIQHNVYSGHLR